MEDNKQKETIDLREVVKTIYHKRRMFYWSLPIAFVLSCAWILPQPREYVTDVILAPERSGEIGGGLISSVAASFGMNLGTMQSDDAIYPSLYPDLFETNGFMISLLDIQVESMDGSIKTDYYTYLTQFQEKNPLTYPVRYVKKVIRNLTKEKRKFAGEDGRINSFMLSEEQEMLLENMKNNITCDVDIKTEIIYITVQDQDPLICALIADSVCMRLQRFITDYRTSKARNDLLYYEKLTAEAKQEYDEAMSAYSEFCDANRRMVLQTSISKRDELENDMQMKLSVYTSMSNLLQGAKAKVQEKTPAFTVLQGASVPTKPNKPKRMLFVAGMMFLTFLGTIVYMFKTEIKEMLMPPSSQRLK